MAMLAPKSSFPARLSPSGSSAMSARDGGGAGGAMSSAGSGSPAMSTITTNLRGDAMAAPANQGYASPIDTDLSDDDGLDSIRTWDEERVGEYLRSVNCGEYEKMFRKNHINGENLLELDKVVLKEMGVDKVGDRVRLWVLIKKLRTRTYASARRRNRDSFGILDGSTYGSTAHSPRSTNAGGGYRSGPSRTFSNQGDLATLENATMASSSRPASPLTPAAAAAADLRGARQPGHSRLGQSPNIAAGPPRPPPLPASPGSQPRAGYHTKNNSSLDGSLMAALPQGQDVIRVISNGGVTKVVKIADCSTCEEVMRVTLRKFGLREDHERNYCFWVLAGIDPDPAQCRRLGDTELWRIVKDQKRPERNRLILRRVPAGEPGDAELDRAAAIAMEEAQQIHSRALEKTADMRSQMKVQKVLGERWNSELQRPLSPVSYQDRERNLLNTTKELERPAASEAILPRARRAILRPFGSMRPPSELITSDLVSYFPDHAREAIDRTARLSMRRSARLSKVNSRLSVASNLSYLSGAVDEPPPIPAIADVWRSASNQIAKARSRESMVAPSPRGGGALAGASPYRDSVGSSMLGTLQEEDGSAEPNRKSYVSFTDVPSPADAAASISVTDTDGNTIVSRGSYGDGNDTAASTLGPAGSGAGSGSGSLDEVQQALAEDGDELDPELQSFLAGESWDDNKWMKGALIGQGSFGSVYLALHAVTGELLAVKQVEMPDPAGGGTSQSDSRKKNMTDALKREISLLRELRHPNIVQYLGCSSSSEYLNIFLEYVAGGSVQTMLSSYGALPEPLVRSFVRQILTGLSYLHNRDIIHRDIKGANILVDNKGTIKISDFGISKKMESANHNNRPSLQGSVFWMAPEVVKQTSYTRKADIWSLGCLVVEMMTGQHPFPDCSQLQAIFKIGGTMAAPTIPPGSSAEAKVFLTKTFEIDHRLRPSADELILSSFLIPIT